MRRFGATAIALATACGVAWAKEPTANSAAAFFEELLSTPGLADCTKPDDVGDYKGISRNCDLIVTADGRVEVSAKEAHGKVISLHAKGPVSYPASMDAIDAVLFFHQATTEGREATDRENLAEARRMRMRLLRAVENKPYAALPFAGAEVQVSLHEGVIRVTVFR